MKHLRLPVLLSVVSVALLGLVFVACVPDLFHPHSDASMARHQRDVIQENVAKLGKALRAYKTTKGEFPETLEELAVFNPEIRKLEDSVEKGADGNKIRVPIDLKAYPFDSEFTVAFNRRARKLQPPRYHYDPKGIVLHNGKRYYIVVADPRFTGGWLIFEDPGVGEYVGPKKK